MNKKIILLYFFVFLKKESRGEAVFSFQLGAGMKNYEQSITLPMGSTIYNQDENYFLSIEPQPLFNSEQIDPISNSIRKTIPKIDLKTIKDAKKLCLNNIFNKVVISGKSFNVPATAKIEYEFFNRLRIGIGVTMEMNIIKNFTLKIKKISLADQIKIIRKNKALVYRIFSNYFVSKSNEKVLVEHLENFQEEDISALMEVVSILDDNQYPGNMKKDLKALIDDFVKNKKFKKNKTKERLETIIYKTAVHFSLSPFVNISYKLFASQNFDLFFEYRFYPMLMHLSGLGSGYSLFTYIFPKFSGNHYFGVILDHSMSEFFSITYGLNFQTSIYTDSNKNNILPLKQNSTWHIGLEFGLSFKIPDYERCYVKNCEVQIKHRHNGQVVRGVNMYTGNDLRGVKIFTKKNT